jgi:hypothetical protein
MRRGARLALCARRFNVANSSKLRRSAKNPTKTGQGVGFDTLPHKEESHDCSGEDGYWCPASSP